MKRIFFVLSCVLFFLSGCASIDNSTLMRAGSASGGASRNGSSRQIGTIGPGEKVKDPVLSGKTGTSSGSASPAFQNELVRLYKDPFGEDASVGTGRDAAEIARQNPGREVVIFKDKTSGAVLESDVVVANPGSYPSSGEASDASGRALGNAPVSDGAGEGERKASDAASDENPRVDSSRGTPASSADSAKQAGNSAGETLQNATAEVRRGVNTVGDVFASLGGVQHSPSANGSSKASAPSVTPETHHEADDQVKISNFPLVIILVAALLIGIAIAYYTVRIKKQQDGDF